MAEPAGLVAARPLSRPGWTDRRPGAGPTTTIAAGTAFGTFGELLQGVLPDGTDFLVTFPIDRWNTARFRLETGRPLRVFPAHKHKSLRLARMLLAAAGQPAGGTLVLDGELPDGKGLASSSADLVATARALSGVLGSDCSPTAVEDWLRRIEPSDGVMYPGVVAFDHRRVRLRSSLGTLSPLTVVAVDEGGQLDTVTFNAIPKPFPAATRREYAHLLDVLSAAVVSGDLATIGRVATRSAVLNQELNPKRWLTGMLNICDQVGGLGVVAAHSGTMLGLLLADGDPAHRERLDRAVLACTALPGRTVPVTVLESLCSDPFTERQRHAL
jgi:uncharacterized protein involved in propanediol utilization